MGGCGGVCVGVCVCGWLVLVPSACTHARMLVRPHARACVDMPSAMPMCTNMPVGGRVSECVCVWVVGLGLPTCMHARTHARIHICACVHMPSAMSVCTDMPSAIPTCRNTPVGGRVSVCGCGWMGGLVPAACAHARMHRRSHTCLRMCRHPIGDADVCRHAVGDADVLQALTIRRARQCAWQHA